ncbi:NfeD family protein [Myxococcus faecalis]|uniref:NfeD family protein n=1 Tax=Myxococcus faecalis TaxID=3115646 RepID=UPI003CF2EE52
MDLFPSAWQLWVAAALVFGVLELKLTGFGLVWFSAGALVASLAAGLGLTFIVQFGLFSAVAIGLITASRTLFKNVFMRDASHLKTGIEAMVGQEAVVTEAIDAPHGGTVRINGELWMARSLTGAILAGELVTVEQVEGLKLWVRRPSATLSSVPPGEQNQEKR